MIALAVGFLPKLIKLVKSIFGLGADVDKEIAKNEKELTGEDTGKDVTIENQEETEEPPPPEQQEKEPPKMNKGGIVPEKDNTTSR